MKPHTAHASSAVPDKAHFALLDLKNLDPNHTIQIPFQIDSVSSCNTLLTRTVIAPYASPPIKPIRQITIKASKGNTAAILLFRIWTLNNQPYSVQKPAKHFGVLTLDADFTKQCVTIHPLSHLMADPPTCKVPAQEGSGCRDMLQRQNHMLLTHRDMEM